MGGAGFGDAGAGFDSAQKVHFQSASPQPLTCSVICMIECFLLLTNVIVNSRQLLARSLYTYFYIRTRPGSCWPTCLVGHSSVRSSRAGHPRLLMYCLCRSKSVKPRVWVPEVPFFNGALSMLPVLFLVVSLFVVIVSDSVPCYVFSVSLVHFD